MNSHMAEFCQGGGIFWYFRTTNFVNISPSNKVSDENKRAAWDQILVFLISNICYSKQIRLKYICRSEYDFPCYWPRARDPCWQQRHVIDAQMLVLLGSTYGWYYLFLSLFSFDHLNHTHFCIKSTIYKSKEKAETISYRWLYFGVLLGKSSAQKT